MPKPFKMMNLDQFSERLRTFGFKRQITSVHMHHTWKPAGKDYKGEPTIAGMWDYHTRVNQWSDIAQHLSIAPDGTLWSGRDWNQPPASASGHNGNSKAGPFMFEIIGNFDRGHERLAGAQREAVIQVIARVQRHFGLPPSTLRFHNQMTDQKSCPGTGVDYGEILAEVKRAHAALQAGGRGMDADERDLPFAASAVEEFAGCGDDSGSREVHEELAEVQVGEPDVAGLRGGFGPDELAALRPHVVSLTRGSLSPGGIFDTSPADVDAIFREHLPRALHAAGGEKLKLVFYAHGGLVSEQAGLHGARVLVDWWKANHVYPIYFIWKTGLWETIGNLVSGRRDLVALDRGLSDVSDRAVEDVARRLGGPDIWDNMKRSAERAAEPKGGAFYVAERLAEFCRANPDRVELHAVGHSAGAIFHAHFIPRALERGAPGFRTLSLLAPAIRVDTFMERLHSRIGAGNGVDSLGVFTMYKDFERADNCKGVYRKSLLYLIHHALEDERRTPILGLEESIRASDELRALLGVEAGSGAGNVVWSRTREPRGRSNSQSTTHGGFDSDSATMESVLRRVLELGDDEPVVRFPEQAARVLNPESEPAPPPVHVASEPPAAPAVHAAGRAGGTRRALCVGINAYPAPNALRGCVADARLWASTLTELGFETPRVLADGAATRHGILAELKALVEGSRAGDVLVFQYAGHGVQFEGDTSGDDEDGRDEGLVAVDMNEGGLILDDELSSLFGTLPQGVSLTCFLDCCHSGTATRFLLQESLAAAGREQPTDIRVRFIDPTPELKAAHRRMRQVLPRGRNRRNKMRWISFAACKDSELAQESGGQGEFTRRAIPLLRDALSRRISNGEFQALVSEAFDNGPAQNPMLDAPPAYRRLPLLNPAAGARTEEGHETGNGKGPGNENGAASADGNGHGRITISIPVDTSTVDVSGLRVLVDRAEQR